MTIAEAKKEIAKLENRLVNLQYNQELQGKETILREIQAIQDSLYLIRKSIER